MEERNRGEYIVGREEDWGCVNKIKGKGLEWGWGEKGPVGRESESA